MLLEQNLFICNGLTVYSSGDGHLDFFGLLRVMLSYTFMGNVLFGPVFSCLLRTLEWNSGSDGD